VSGLPGPTDSEGLPQSFRCNAGESGPRV